ncbi:MAG: AAA family ATPase [Caldilineaceae bacterium]
MLPNRLYGRKHEWEEVSAGFNRTMQGTAELLLLMGDAGIGKTALIGEVAAMASARGATVIACRTDAQAQTVAYTTVSGLLAEFIQQILARPAEEVNAWRQRLTTVPAGNTALLLRTIPTLALILEQPEERHAELSDLHHLLRRNLQKFLTLIAEFAQPLVMIVDDAHEADLELESQYAGADHPWPIWVIIWACRGRSGNTKFGMFIDELSSSKGARASCCNCLLTVADTGRPAGDTFHAPDEHIGVLAQLLHTKTLGNLFLREFLQFFLVDQRLIYFLTVSSAPGAGI